MTEFKNLENALKQEEAKHLSQQLQKLETEEGLKQALQWNGKQYKGDVKTKLTAFITKQSQKTLNEQLAKLKAVSEAEDFNNNLIVSLDWIPNRMYRSNPKAYTNYGFKGSSVSGCGYDKQSTALAEGLNSYLPLLKLMYAKKDKELNQRKKTYKEQNGIETEAETGINNFCFGYGAGYGILPRFEGGVGTQSHKNIIQSLGLEFEQMTNAPNSDAFIISRKSNCKASDMDKLMEKDRQGI